MGVTYRYMFYHLSHLVNQTPEVMKYYQQKKKSHKHFGTEFEARLTSKHGSSQ